MFVTRKNKNLFAALTATTLLVTTAACSPQTQAAGSDQVQVLAAFYPLAFVAEQIGSERVSVTTLTPAGAEPHDLELAPAHTRKIGEADLVLFQTAFQPAVDEAVRARDPKNVIDSAHLATLALDPEHSHGDEEGGEDDHDHGPNDPHFWLDPELLSSYAGEVAEELSTLDPAGATEYAANLEQLQLSLENLDQDYSDGLATCKTRSIVLTHAAFGYPAQRYDFDQIAIIGVDPEAEPSPAKLKNVAATIGELGIDTIFFETLVSPKVAQTLAGDLGVSTQVLDPIEGLTEPDTSYFTIMESNLDALRTGMQCS